MGSGAHLVLRRFLRIAAVSVCLAKLKKKHPTEAARYGTQRSLAEPIWKRAVFCVGKSDKRESSEGKLGGGNSNIFEKNHPKSWGFHDPI